MRSMTTGTERTGMSETTRQLIEKLDRDHWLSDAPGSGAGAL